MEKYENLIEHACDIQEGQVWIANGWQRADGLCDSAWESMSAFVMTLAHGGGDFYDGWMKNPQSAMISCNDGFRPVSFYIEALTRTQTKQKTALRELPLSAVNHWLGKPPAMPVEVPRKKALASSIERSELIAKALTK